MESKSTNTPNSYFTVFKPSKTAPSASENGQVLPNSIAEIITLPINGCPQR